MAAHLGETDAEDIHWVHASDRNSPARLISGDDATVATPAEDVPVVVVSAQGRFVVPDVGLDRPGERPETEPRAHPFLYVTIDEGTGEVLGTYITETDADLSELGEVESAVYTP